MQQDFFKKGKKKEKRNEKKKKKNEKQNKWIELYWFLTFHIRKHVTRNNCFF